MNIGEQIMKIQNFPYVAFPVTFKKKSGLFQFIWDIWCLNKKSSGMQESLSKHNFIPNSKWIKFPILVHCDISVEKWHQFEEFWQVFIVVVKNLYIGGS